MHRVIYKAQKAFFIRNRYIWVKWIFFAKDAECYDLFSDIFYPLISEYHKIDIKNLQSIHDLGDPSCLTDLPAHLASEILSTRIRVGRTVKGFPMAGKLSKEVKLAVRH